MTTLHEARETIRRFDPDLADLLDLHMPVVPEELQHKHARPITQAAFDDLEYKDPEVLYIILP